MKGKRNPVAKAVRRLRPLAIRSKRRDVPRKQKDKGRFDAALRLSA
jgi:hypothetical protein